MAVGRQPFSEEKEQAIDAEVKKLCQEAYATTMATLTAHRQILDELTESLLEKETVDGFELNAIIERITGKPPPTPFNPVPVAVKADVAPEAPTTA
jgi:cell division protease FtsH